jgi:hypothetical protein
MPAIAELITAVAVARQRLVNDVGGLSETQATWQPAPDAWSVAQVLEHLVLAEQHGVWRLWRAAEGVRTSAPLWQGEAVHRGQSIEAIIAATWGSQPEAPPAATPQTNGPLGYWVAALAACQPVLAALGPLLAGLDLAVVIAPHHLSGPLDAEQRLGFVRWHLEHHREQIAAIVAAMA